VNDYEVLIMLDPELPEERQGEIVTRAQEFVTKNGGTWGSQEPWGRRRLAYEIDHKSEGAYHLLTFSSTPETLDEVSRVLKITEGVMRHLATRRPKLHRRQEARPDTREAAPEPTPLEEEETDGR
jgi:small subunit ribosomal protein S6